MEGRLGHGDFRDREQSSIPPTCCINRKTFVSSFGKVLHFAFVIIRNRCPLCDSQLDMS